VPRSMKMGTIASPFPYDTAARGCTAPPGVRPHDFAGGLHWAVAAGYAELGATMF